MFKGLGQLVFANSTKLYVGRLNVFQLTQEIETKEATAWPFSGGALQVVDSVKSTETWTLKVGMSSFDKNDLSFVLDEYIQTTASINLPFAAQTTVPSTGPYTVTVTGLTADQVVQASVISDTAPKFLEQIPTADVGTIADGEYAISANTITFDDAQAGATVAYRYMKAYTSIETIGAGATGTEYGTMGFSGILVGPRFPTGTKIYLPKVSRKSGIDLSVADETQAELEYSVEVATGFRKQYVLAFGAA